MQKLVNFLEKSIQWVALGIAGVFLLLCFYWFLFTPPATVKLGTTVVAPSEIDEITQNGPVAAIEHDIRNARAEPIKVTDVIAPWKNQIGNPPPIQLAGGAFDTITGKQITAGPEGHENLALVSEVAALPKATPLSVQAGMSVAQALPGPNGQAVAGAPDFDVLWASIAFSIPGKDLATAFEKPLVGKPDNFATFYRTAYLNIELQRQQAIGHDANGQAIFPDGNNGIQTVTVAKVNQAEIQPLPAPNDTKDTKSAFSQWAQSNEMAIRQPKFYTIKAGTIWIQPVLPGQAAAVPGAAPAPAAPRPPMAPAPGAAAANGGQVVAGIDPMAIKDDQLVWAHDDTVEPGRTYRYRVVYHMMNPVFELQNIAAPKIFEQLDIPSAPSDWTAPVTIPQNVQYWVRSLQHGDTAALVDVFKWELGKWQKFPLSLAPGDTIPGTEQTIVDIHGNSNGKEHDKYVLLTDASGEPIRHIPSDDRVNATYKDLLVKTSPDAGAGGAGAGVPQPPPRPGAGRSGAMPTR
jgi:hypothetical protein